MVDFFCLLVLWWRNQGQLQGGFREGKNHVLLPKKGFFSLAMATQPTNQTIYRDAQAEFLENVQTIQYAKLD